MALNPNYTSVARVIEKAYERADYDKINWQRAITKVGEVLALIGVPDLYEEALTIVEVEDYAAPLPDDVYILDMCRFVITDDNTTTGQVTHIAPLIATTDEFYLDPALPQTTAIEEVGALSYRVNNEIIQTNFGEGLIQIKYKKFVTDDDGLPMVPDDEKFMRALECTIIEDEDYRMWRRGKIPNAVYQQSKQDKAWAIASARSEAHIPTTDEMESIKNRWVRMIPRVDLHKFGFRSLNLPETRYRK